MRFPLFVAAMAGCALLSSLSNPAVSAPLTGTNDPVLFWNDVLLEAIRISNTPPPVASRAMAMVHLSVFDAVNVANGAPYQGYGTMIASGLNGVSAQAAAAAAAHNILVNAFPGRRTVFDAALAEQLTLAGHGAEVDRGVALGTRTSAAILSLRSGDGASLPVFYAPGTGPGSWSEIPLDSRPPAVPQYATVEPWAMTSPDQFRAPPPPALDSEAYAAAFDRVKDLGSLNSTTRTADQTAIAHYWEDGSGTATPPGHWLAIAADVAELKGQDVLTNARMMALLAMSVADAAISAWDTKYTYDFWRPVQGIRRADEDGNALTAQDSLWTPLLGTPNHPSFTSGHSTFSGAAGRLLDMFYDEIDFRFCSPQEKRADIIRCWNSFEEAALEGGLSRIYGGIHWDFDDSAGQTAGRQVAENVFAGQLRQVPTPASLLLLGVGLIALPLLHRQKTRPGPTS